MIHKIKILHDDCEGLLICAPQSGAGVVLQYCSQAFADGRTRHWEQVGFWPRGVAANPSLTMCLADPGELRCVLIGGIERTLHFVVFVLSRG